MVSGIVINCQKVHDQLWPTTASVVPLFMQNGPILLYDVRLSEKGRMMVDAWKSGDRQAVAYAMVHARTTT